MKVVILTGGGGGARLCAGFASVLRPADLTIVANTGDDERMRGLHISPDVDTVLYYLAGLVDWQRGWGLQKESFSANDRFRELVVSSGVADDMQDWFTLGDRDLATHMFRTRLLQTGSTLTRATDALRRAFGVEALVLPMSDDPVRTMLVTASGITLDFQTYFVRNRHGDEITSVVYEGAPDAAPARGVIDAIGAADLIVIPPSNPMLSIDPILSVAGVREAVLGSAAKRVAVSPIVGGKAIKGPADRMLASLGWEVSCVGIARIYKELADLFVFDMVDAARAPEIAMRSVCVDTMMPGPDEAARVAKAVLDAV